MSRSGLTPLTAAAAFGLDPQDEMLPLLLQLGADVTVSTRPASQALIDGEYGTLHIATLGGDAGAVRLLAGARAQLQQQAGGVPGLGFPLQLACALGVTSMLASFVQC